MQPISSASRPRVASARSPSRSPRPPRTTAPPLYLSLTADPAGRGQDTRGGVDNLTLTVDAPEPASLALLGFGAAVLGMIRRRRA
jgi:hypothetical protein